MATAGWMAAASIGGSLLSSRNNRNAQRDASNALSDSEAAALEYQRQATEEARNAAIPLYQQAQDNSMMGTQAAMDVYGNLIPQQLDAFSRGNFQAQQMLGSGLAQQQNAILGNPISNAAFQPRGIGQIDTSMFNQQLPEFGRIEDALAGWQAGGQAQQSQNPYGNITFDAWNFGNQPAMVSDQQFRQYDRSQPFVDTNGAYAAAMENFQAPQQAQQSQQPNRPFLDSNGNFIGTSPRRGG